MPTTLIEPEEKTAEQVGTPAGTAPQKGATTDFSGFDKLLASAPFVEETAPAPAPTVERDFSGFDRLLDASPLAEEASPTPPQPEQDFSGFDRLLEASPLVEDAVPAQAPPPFLAKTVEGMRPSDKVAVQERIAQAQAVPPPGPAKSPAPPPSLAETLVTGAVDVAALQRSRHLEALAAPVRAARGVLGLTLYPAVWLERFALSPILQKVKGEKQDIMQEWQKAIAEPTRFEKYVSARAEKQFDEMVQKYGVAGGLANSLNVQTSRLVTDIALMQGATAGALGKATATAREGPKLVKFLSELWPAAKRLTAYAAAMTPGDEATRLKAARDMLLFHYGIGAAGLASTPVAAKTIAGALGALQYSTMEGVKEPVELAHIMAEQYGGDWKKYAPITFSPMAMSVALSAAMAKPRNPRTLVEQWQAKAELEKGFRETTTPPEHPPPSPFRQRIIGELEAMKKEPPTPEAKPRSEIAERMRARAIDKAIDAIQKDGTDLTQADAKTIARVLGAKKPTGKIVKQIASAIEAARAEGMADEPPKPLARPADLTADAEQMIRERTAGQTPEQRAKGAADFMKAHAAEEVALTERLAKEPQMRERDRFLNTVTPDPSFRAALYRGLGRPKTFREKAGEFFGKHSELGRPAYRSMYLATKANRSAEQRYQWVAQDIQKHIDLNDPYERQMFGAFIDANSRMEIGQLIAERRLFRKIAKGGRAGAEAPIQQLVKRYAGFQARKGEPSKTPENAAAALEMMARDNPALFSRMQKAGEIYWKAGLEALNTYRENGVISAEDYESLVNLRRHYMPIHQYQYLDRMTGPTVEITGGSRQPVATDARYTLSRVIRDAQVKSARNRAFVELYDYMKTVGKDSVLQIETTEPKQARAGTYSQVTGRIDGKETSLWMPQWLREQWLTTPYEITADKLRALALTETVALSGATKPFATGFNPEFAFGNVPKDIQGVNVRLPHLFATARVLPHLRSAWHEAVSGRGPILDLMVKENALPSTLTEMGSVEHNPYVARNVHRFMGKLPQPMQRGLTKALSALAWFGNMSEISTRIAVVKDALAHGASPQEAAYAGENVMPFSRRTYAMQVADRAFPYASAGIVATRGMLENARENPANFATKVVLLNSLATTISALAWRQHPEAMSKVSDEKRVMNWMFPTGVNFRFEDGETEPIFLTIPKDQGQAFLSALSESLVDEAMGGRPNLSRRLAVAASAVLPGDISLTMPSAGAVLALRGTDPYRLEPIWRGPESRAKHYRRDTPEIYKMLGGLKAGPFGPTGAEELRRAVGEIVPQNNPLTWFMGGEYQPFLKTVPAANDKLAERLYRMSKAPITRKFVYIPPHRPLTDAEKIEADRLSVPSTTEDGLPIRTSERRRMLKEAQSVKPDSTFEMRAELTAKLAEHAAGLITRDELQASISKYTPDERRYLQKRINDDLRRHRKALRLEEESE